VQDDFRDQTRETGHFERLSDLDGIASLGIRTVRYPVLWEQVAPQSLNQPDWQWPDRRLHRLRELRMRPIVGLVHHGSGPAYTNLLDPQFPALLAQYADMVAARYPWVEDFTPVNEPLTTARFSCLYGHWYPHLRDIGATLRALYHECWGTALAMRAIRRRIPNARLVQTEDLGKVFSTPLLKAQADHENERRWLSFDLLCGRIGRHHPWHSRFVRAGISEDQLAAFVDEPCTPDVFGINHYLSSDRFLDQRRTRYPEHTWGGNGTHAYADVEAVRVRRKDIVTGFAARLQEVWERYGQPIAVTEVHNGCTREEQVRWLIYVYESVKSAKAAGVDVRAMTAWALMGSMDWSSLLTRRDGHYEPGVFDASATPPRPTAIAAALKAIVDNTKFDHPIMDAPGWWQRDMRYYRSVNAAAPAMTVPTSARKLLVTGASGTLGQAFSRLSMLRGLDHVLTSRRDMDVADPRSVMATLERIRPWAVINTAGYVRVPDAEREPDRCHRENSEGARVLAEVCAKLGIPFLTFSSDLVFDGMLGRSYLESDIPRPTTVYGASKAAAENYVRSVMPEALIVRTSAFFGPWDPYNFIHRTLAELGEGRHVLASSAYRVSPTYVPHLVNRSLDLLIDGASGIWHVAGESAVSWVELGRMAAARAGLDPDMVIPHANDVRETSTALGSERGRLLPPLESALEQFLRERAAA
jgi:dTDP-4-dehydrorhamnose reductase